MAEKHVTIRDVAKVAGVSITTASQVMNGFDKFSDATVKRVWSVANELGYKPNQYAIKLFAKEPMKHRETGLLMRIIYTPYNSGSLFSRQWEYDRISLFEQACLEQNCNGTTYIYRHEYGMRSRLLLNDVVDGVVLGLPHRDIIKAIRGRIPAVLTDINVRPEDVGMPVVNFDLRRGFSEAISLVRQNGLTGKMAILSGYNDELSSSILTRELLTRNLENAAAECGVPVEKRHNFQIEVFPGTTEKAIEQIADRLAKCIRKENIQIITTRYIQPVSLLKQALEKRGIRLPHDAVIISVESLKKPEPGMICLHFSWSELMRKAVEVLLELIQNPQMACREYFVPCDLYEENISTMMTAEKKKAVKGKEKK